MIPSYQIDVTEDSHNHVTLHMALPHRVDVQIPLSRWDAGKIAHAIRTDTPIPYRITSQTGIDYHWQGKVARKRVTITLNHGASKATITLGYHETSRFADLLAPLPEGTAA